MTFFHSPISHALAHYIRLHNFPLSFQPGKDTRLMVFCCFFFCGNFYDIFITYICANIGFGLVIDCVMCSALNILLLFQLNALLLACMHIANLLALFNGR
jgi:hypothetical protein